MKTHNKYVATAPMAQLEERKYKKVGGMSFAEERMALMPLKVVFSGDEFLVGDTVYINALNAKAHTWAGQVFTINGVEFILVPMDFILMSDQDTSEIPF
jgi:hypothetical protein